MLGCSSAQALAFSLRKSMLDVVEFGRRSDVVDIMRGIGAPSR
jgi:hypothetical protein